MKKNMRLSYKYRLYPTKAQAQFLEHQLFEAADLYNCAVQERKDAWKTCRKNISYYDQACQLKAMRAEGLIGLVTFSCCQDVLQRVDRAFQAFFRRTKRGEKPGYPRYRSSRRYNSITYATPEHGWRLFENGKLRIQGAGHIKVKLHRPVEGTLKTATIKRAAGRWFVCFSVERAATPLLPRENAIGVDLGLHSFAALSDGTLIPNPRHYRKAQAALRRTQRKVTRRKAGSNRRRKAAQLLQRAHARVYNQRADFHHQMSRQLVNRYGTIAVEDLNLEWLVKSNLAKSIRDAGWSQFTLMLAYKAEEAGRRLVKVNPKGTSQICVCGASVPKSLSDRWHHCRACGLSAARDHVSAQVILSRARNGLSGANVEDVISRVS